MLALLLAAILVLSAAAFSYRPFSTATTEQHSERPVMLILRGIANAKSPRGQLDDRSAREYARRLGFRGEVLDVAGNNGVESPQVKAALDRIRRDEQVTAIYGFSGGGYNLRHIWAQLSSAEREQIAKIVIIGAPGVEKTDFAESKDVVIKGDPPSGHMAGPKALLESLGPT